MRRKVHGRRCSSSCSFFVVRRSCTSATDLLASHHCCACATQRVNRRDLEPSGRISETYRNVHRPGTDRRRSNAAQRDRVSFSPCFFRGTVSSDGYVFTVKSFADSAKTALQTVAAGQASENLLDFDDEPASEEPKGLAATQVLQQPAAKSIMSGTSANPLDDLVSIFGSASLSSTMPIGPGPPSLDAFGGIAPQALPTAAPSLNQQEDLLGLF